MKSGAWACPEPTILCRMEKIMRLARSFGAIVGAPSLGLGLQAGQPSVCHGPDRHFRRLQRLPRDCRRLAMSPWVRSTLITGQALLLALAATAGVARASVLDPQIYLQQSAGNVQAGGPNVVTAPSSFVVSAAGNLSLNNPLLIIVGAYDGNGTPTVT